MPIPLLLLSPQLVILAVNDAYLMATLTTRSELIGKALFDIFPAGFPLPASSVEGDIGQSIARMLESLRPDAISLCRQRTGTAAASDSPPVDRHLQLIHAPLIDDQGELSYIVQYIDDPGPDRWLYGDTQPTSVLAENIEADLAQLDRIVAAAVSADKILVADLRQGSTAVLLESIPDSLLVIDRNWRIAIINSLAAKAHGKTKEAMMGKDLRGYVEAPVIEAVQQVMAQQQLVACEYFAESSTRWWYLRMSPALDDGVAILMTDITENKLAEACQLHAAQHDALTGLANRKLFHADAERVLSWSHRLRQKLAILFIDLDNFKPINDNYGHEVGDKVLKLAADRLTLLLRAADLIGRYGGDEFTAVLVGIDNASDAKHVADNILDALRKPYLVDDLSLNISASIGISFFPDNGENIDQLIRHADYAMYESKNGGRSRCNFYRNGTATPLPPESERENGKQKEKESDKESSMESRVRNALSSGEFSLVFQPVFSTSTQQVVEAEALIRWRQNDGSYIRPEIFLSIAELTGLTPRIGEWLLNAACGQQQRWKEEGLPSITIAVKIPGIQFRQKDFDQTVAAALNNTGLPPAHLLLEIAENTVLGNAEESARIMQSLKNLGVSVAITNFGAGNSNVRALSCFPIDKLKVDRSFMQHAYRSGEHFAATDAIIGLGHSLHKEIVAQGIENDEDMAYVRSHGCQYSQGYLLAPPMPPAEFARWWMQSTASGHVTRH